MQVRGGAGKGGAGEAAGAGAGAGAGEDRGNKVPGDDDREGDERAVKCRPL